jgi:aminotransferase in exopolysaccharide biosynthesis
MNSHQTQHHLEMSSPVEKIVSAVASAIGPGPAVLHEPYFTGNEWGYVKECLDSTFVSSVGKFVDRLEADLVAFTGAKYAIAVVNGTSALHIALMLAGVQEGDEVLIPTLTFVATANAVRYCGAEPHFVDCEMTTLGLAPDPLREHLKSISEIRNGACFNRQTGSRISALVPMHTFGHPVRMAELLEVAYEFKLLLIEDAAESLGSYYCGRHTGTMGLMGILSFNGNKIITTGGGGAILTNDEMLAKKAKHLTTTAKLQHPWAYEHDEVGYNYRLPNINAALGCAQLEKLPGFLEDKRKLYQRYRDAFAGISGMQIVGEPPDCKSNFWLQTLQIDASDFAFRNIVLETTASAGYMCRPIWIPIHKLSPYKNCSCAPLPISELLESRLINLPSSVTLAKNL